MNKIKVLIEGYAKETKMGWLANSTVVSIQSNEKNIIVDQAVIERSYLKHYQIII